MIKPNVKDGSFVKHTIGETLEAGWLVKIERPGEFATSELGFGDGPYLGIVLKQLSDRETGGAKSQFWRILLPNGKMLIVTPEEVELVSR